MSTEPPPNAVEHSHAAAWLATWRARQWTRWRLEVLAEAMIWAGAAGLAMLTVTSNALVAVAAGLGVVGWRAFGSGMVRDVRAMLAATEAAEPTLQNSLLTWHEVDAGVLSASPAFRHRLIGQTQAALRRATPPAPRRGRDWALAVTAGCASLLGWWLAPPARHTPTPTVPVGAHALLAPTLPSSIGVAFVVTPPAYTGRRPAAVTDADVVEALVGSNVQARYEGLPHGATARIGERTLALTWSGAVIEAQFDVTTSALLSVHDGSGQVLRSTTIQAVPDAAPVVRVAEPGRDLRVADAARIIPVTVSAVDDLGLRSLRLLYTRVTGSGESFEFADGELPVVVRRASPVSWQGRAALDLTALGMGPGDTLVYFAVAGDGRPGAAGLAESERYLVEIPKPGDLAGGDFSLPEPEHRYAISQRMVIQLTERLLERRTRMDPVAYTREAQGLAVQQRRVRAEFVFLMGGDVVDEVEEAEHSHEVEAGRLDNSGQQELLDAVRQMAQAEQRLTDANLQEALPYEYRALNALQAAFGKARYFMRTLPATVAIDMTRRGSGDLDLADPSSWQRAPLPPDMRRRARVALARVASLTPATDVSDVTGVADALVDIDPYAPAWLGLVQTLADVFVRQRPDAARRAAIDEVAGALRARLLPSAPASVPLPLGRGGDEAGLARAGRTRR